MGMQLNVKSEDAYRLASRLAELTGAGAEARPTQQDYAREAARMFAPRQGQGQGLEIVEHPQPGQAQRIRQRRGQAGIRREAIFGIRRRTPGRKPAPVPARIPTVFPYSMAIVTELPKTP